MAIEENDPKLVFVPLEEATTPPAGLIEHLKDRWWAIHPEKGLIFYKAYNGNPSAQCNPSETTSRALNEKLYPWAEIKFVPSVFRRVNPHDYV
jgi:hypothetical protein